MASSLIGAFFSIVGLLVLSWVSSVLKKAKADEEARKEAELEAKIAKQALSDVYEIEVKHEARLQKILDDSLSDDDAGRMLSCPPSYDPDSGAPNSKDGDR